MKKEFENLIKVELIENYIKDNNLTIKAFWERCKISYSVYRRVITGKNFKLTAIFRIAKVLGKDIHILFKNKIPQI